MYELGQWVRKVENEQRVQVLESFKTWGYSSYKFITQKKIRLSF